VNEAGNIAPIAVEILFVEPQAEQKDWNG